MESECILHNSIVLAISLPEIIKVGRNLTELWQKQFKLFFIETLCRNKLPAPSGWDVTPGLFWSAQCSGVLYSLIGIWWNGLHRPILQRNLWYFVWWCATSGISLQRPALTNADWLHRLNCYIFTHESSYCFHRVLAIAILFVRLFVCPSVRHTGGSVKSGAS